MCDTNFPCSLNIRLTLLRFDLPPSETAYPLPVNMKRFVANQSTRQKSRRHRLSPKSDDAPRSFKRLMAVAQGKITRSGLDEGRVMKRKSSESTASVASPHIRPGEDLRAFASRVDATLPITGLAKRSLIKDGKDILGLKVHRTRKERKMHKLYDQWREEEHKIQERREEELELSAEKDLGIDAASIPISTSPDDKDEDSNGIDREGKRCRQGRSSLHDDPWLELKKQRAETKIGLHEVALAPPKLHKMTTKLLRVGSATVNVHNVPRAAGSLRRREELQVEREHIVAAYRKLREHEQFKLNN